MLEFLPSPQNDHLTALKDQRSPSQSHFYYWRLKGIEDAQSYQIVENLASFNNALYELWLLWFQ
jgi:hypothetical protein